MSPYQTVRSGVKLVQKYAKTYADIMTGEKEYVKHLTSGSPPREELQSIRRERKT